MMTKEEKHVLFDWECLKCGIAGSGCDLKPWKYCPMCGSKLEVKIDAKH